MSHSKLRHFASLAAVTAVFLFGTPAVSAPTQDCVVDVAGGTNDCTGPYDVKQTRYDARVEVRVPDGHELIMQLEICEPTGWVVNVGDSPTNNGGGGDWGSRSHDAELHIENTDLAVIASDHAIGKPNRRRELPGLLNSEWCQFVVITIADRRLSVVANDVEHVFEGRHLLRLNPAHDREGAPDNFWYVGLNRVIDSGNRVGSGVTFATFEIRPESRRRSTSTSEGRELGERIRRLFRGL